MPNRSDPSLSLSKRLELIREAVLYCRRVKSLGMPTACYTKALREPVHYLWERRLGSKRQAASHRSVAAGVIQSSSRDLVYDHAIPFNYLQTRLLEIESLDLELLEGVLRQHAIAVWITREEDSRLTKAGLQRIMPDGWDRTDMFARYRAVGIEIVKNECYCGDL